MFALSVIIISCLSVVVAIFLMQCWLEQRYGEIAAKWLLPKEVIQFSAMGIAVSIALWAGIKICSRFNLNVVMIAGFVIGLSALWTAWWIVRSARQKAGKVLVDVGKVEPRGMYAVAAFILLSLWAFALSVTGPDLFMALNGLLFASSAGLSYSISRMSLLFTEKGIFTPNGAIYWQEIEGYRWTGGTETAHTLVLTLRRPFFKTKVFSISWSYLDQISNVMEVNVGQAILDQVAGESQDESSEV